MLDLNQLESKTLSWAQALIDRQSITPDDAGCQQLMADHLKTLGFEITTLVFEDTTNLWAIKKGTQSLKNFTFAGHTDVVPAGDLEAWRSPPFQSTIRDHALYGRGAADMKGALAAMIVSVTCFLEQYPMHANDISFLITSDEEGPFINGTIKVVEYLIDQKQRIDYCIIGEPSSEKRLGDMIKNGRRGSLTGTLKVIGTQGHVAYPELVKNPIHACLKALDQLATYVWDMGNDYFPATSFQIVNLNSGTGATNVVPGDCHVQFNFRYSSELTSEIIKEQVAKMLDSHQFDYQLTWSLSGEPFLTPAGVLSDSCYKVIKQNAGIETKLSTSGGTSDGRFISKICSQVVELGLINATIHQVNESVQVEDLGQLASIYFGILEDLVCSE